MVENGDIPMLTKQQHTIGNNRNVRYTGAIRGLASHPPERTELRFTCRKLTHRERA